MKKKRNKVTKMNFKCRKNMKEIELSVGKV